MKSFFLDKLPDCITVAGKSFFIKTDFRVWLGFSQTIQENKAVIDEADFVFSNEECKQSAMNMAKYKDEEFKKFLCYYFKFGEKLFEMYKNGDYKIDEI